MKPVWQKDYIRAVRPSGKVIPVHVRAKTTPGYWFADAADKVPNPSDHFVVFLDYIDWADPRLSPRVWVVPYSTAKRKMIISGVSRNGKRCHCIDGKKIFSMEKNADAWHLIQGKKEA